MRALMNLIKNRHGTYYAQRKVPERIQAAVASVLGRDKARQVFLKRSLGTKDLKLANKRAKLVLHEFDQIISKAEAQVAEAPRQAPRTTLNSTETRLVADYVYARLMREDEEWRFGGKRYLEKQEAWLKKEGVEFTPLFDTATLPSDGISAEQLKIHYEYLRYELETMQGALAQGDVSAIADDLDIALDALGIPLEKGSDGYRTVGIEALRAYVRALRDIEKRDAGEPIETPAFNTSPALGGMTLEAAYEGWTKQRARPQGTLSEYKRGIDLFTQLHGVLPVASIKRAHAREFREALQLVPRIRTGKLLKATLPDLRDYGRSHPGMQKISSGTVNKLLGAVQAVCVWARDNGFIPDDLHWADPFNKMRVAEAESERTSFEIEELQCLFDSPVFTKREWPQGARGVTAVWLPLLALFTGARRSELAGLTEADVELDKATGTRFIVIRAEAKRGKTVKTRTSQRVVPIHPQLVKLGFLKYVEQIRESSGKGAWLFPLVAPDKGYALAAWTKWFGRYLRTQGVDDTAKVFHSFRHTFKDALRKGGVNPEVHDALTGHANASTVSGGYECKLTEASAFTNLKGEGESDIVKWATVAFGADDHLTKLLKAEQQWVAQIIRKRNAVEHPGGRSGALTFNNIRRNPDSESFVLPTWMLTGEVESDILKDMNVGLDNMLTVAEDFLAGVMLRNSGAAKGVLSVYEIPSAERDPQCPIRLRVGPGELLLTKLGRGQKSASEAPNKLLTKMVRSRGNEARVLRQRDRAWRERMKREAKSVR